MPNWLTIHEFKARFLTNLERLLKFFYFYLAFVGIFGFSCFIMEEGIQMISFANFSASDNRNYQAMSDNLDLAENINHTKRAIAKWTLWLIPPQRLAYIAYADSVDQYILTMRQEILANQPDIFLGREIIITDFRYLALNKLPDGRWAAKNRDLDIILPSKPHGAVIGIDGVLERDNKTDRLYIQVTGDSHEKD